MPRATRADVAQLAGVSVATVSHVLNGRGPELGFAVATIEKVYAAADEVGYIPSAAARSFRYQKSTVIALIVGLIPADLRMPVFNEVLLAALAAAEHRGYRILPVLLNPDTPQPSSTVRSILADVDIAGALVQCEPHLVGVGRMLEQADIPMAWLGIHENSTIDTGALFVVDETAGVEALLEAIDTDRIRNAGILCGPGPHSGRVDAFLRAFPAATITVADGWDTESGARAMDKVIATGVVPDLVFAANDYLAAGVLVALRAHDIPVPDQTQVCGWGDYHAPREPGGHLTSIYWPLSEITTAAVDHLVDVITGITTDDDRQVIVAATARPRASTIDA